MNHISYSVLFAIMTVRICSTNLFAYANQQLFNSSIIFTLIQQDATTNTNNHPQLSKLVFITPWNHAGKQLTIKYAHKIEYVSPCWYELVLRGDEDKKKVGFQNDLLVDLRYLEGIKSANPNIKILPRVYLNNFELIRHVASHESNFVQLIQLINSIFSTYPLFDGIVWDSPYNTFPLDQHRQPLNNFMHQLTNQIKRSFHSKSTISGQPLLLFFNMANPSQRQLETKLYQSLDVDGLLIQNYDSSGDFHGMIRNSIRWVVENEINININKERIFLLLPFFSYKNGQAIGTGDAKRELQSDGIYSQGYQRGMCRFLSKKNKKYLVPCYKYFSQAYRLIKASQLHVGYWQGGNGLQNYYVFM